MTMTMYEILRAALLDAAKERGDEAFVTAWEAETASDTGACERFVWAEPTLPA